MITTVDPLLIDRRLAICGAPFVAGDTIHYMVICLILGIIGTHIGFIEVEFFQKANGFGLMMFTVLVMCFSALPDITPDILVSLIIPWFVVFVLGILAIAICTFIVGNGVERTIQNVGELGRQGMHETDQIILDLMTKE